MTIDERPSTSRGPLPYEPRDEFGVQPLKGMALLLNEALKDKEPELEPIDWEKALKDN